MSDPNRRDQIPIGHDPSTYEPLTIPGTRTVTIEEQNALSILLFEELVNYDWPTTEEGQMRAREVALQLLHFGCAVPDPKRSMSMIGYDA